MAKITLLLGGNEKGTRRAFKEAVQLIDKTIGKVVYLSALYTSPPWGFEHPDWFLNQALESVSFLSPMEILSQTQLIEKKLGRKKKTTTHYDGRIIDIDILFIENKVIHTPDLEIPHPRLHLRRFTLLPLTEWKADFIHPVQKKSISTLLAQCPDNSEVYKVV